MTVYFSSALHGEALKRVLTHEVCHCAMMSYNLIEDIHRMVLPTYWVEAEEWVCNLIADYGASILERANEAYEEWS